MIADILHEAVSDAQTVKSLILAGEKLRSFVSADQADYAALRADPVLANVIADLPDTSAWRMFDHCASLTRLYAILERFIGKMVRSWLAEMPKVCGTYAELGEPFRRVHRRGVARVLMDLDKARFSSLGEETVVDGLLKAVTGVASYSILPEAFLSDTRSLKKERIEELLSQVLLQGGWQWIEKHRFVVSFIEDTRGGQNTPEAELRGFVNYRNEAAHGSVDQILGSAPLSEYADFIIAICKALDELVRWNWVGYCKEKGHARVVGKVTEHFRNNVIVANVERCTLAKNMELLLRGQHCCYSTCIESIQLNDVEQDSIAIEDETEVGLKLSMPAPKRSELLLVQQVADSPT